MDQPNLPAGGPSAAKSAIFGALVGLLIGGVIPFVMALRNGEYHEGAAFRLSACICGASALLGFDLAVWRRQGLGGSRKEEWDRFMRSPAFGIVLMIVIFGSLGMVYVSGQMFDLVGRSTP